MLISISGTHYMGKTTFISDFIQAHPEYKCVQESYYELLEQNDVEAALEPSLEGLLEQLDFSIEQLQQHIHDENIIFDRCPLDFIAYAMCCADEEHIDLNENEIAERFIAVRELMQHLSLVIFFPVTAQHTINYPEENPAYRIAADLNFKKLFRDDIFDLFPEYNNPRIVELVGDTKTRLQQIESYL